MVCACMLLVLTSMSQKYSGSKMWSHLLVWCLLHVTWIVKQCMLLLSYKVLLAQLYLYGIKPGG